MIVLMLGPSYSLPLLNEICLLVYFPLSLEMNAEVPLLLGKVPLGFELNAVVIYPN
jgi:hypothetical protein